MTKVALGEKERLGSAHHFGGKEDSCLPYLFVHIDYDIIASIRHLSKL